MHVLYYDESEHSRSLTSHTVLADNFYDGFVTVIVGWDEADAAEIETRYADFERRHSNRASNGEIKSSTIKPDQLSKGFHSLGKANLQSVEDFLSVFDDKILVHLSFQSKLEYMVEQLFHDYDNSQYLNMDLMRYSIAKTLAVYQPRDIISAIYKDPTTLVNLLRQFFYERLAAGLSNPSLKSREIGQYGQILLLLDSVSRVERLNWDYSKPFVGLLRYLRELDIDDYALVIDEEHQTVDAARRIGIGSTCERNSKDCVGLRMADMLAGIICKLLKALHDAIRYHNETEYLEKRLVSVDWFRIDERRFALYKQLSNIVLRSHAAWDKIDAGSYSDDLVVFVMLLTIMDSFSSVSELCEASDMCPEWLNTTSCTMLEERYRLMMEDALTVTTEGPRPVVSTAPLLDLCDGVVILQILSVGYDGLGIPLVLVNDGDRATCYRLPADLRSWAINLASLEEIGHGLLPGWVRFTTTGQRHRVDIL